MGAATGDPDTDELLQRSGSAIRIGVLLDELRASTRDTFGTCDGFALQKRTSGDALSIARGGVPGQVPSLQLFLIQALPHERIWLEEVADGIWSVYFYGRLLPRLDQRDYKLYP